MSIPTALAKPREIDYPDCDGLPMAENTLQWEWNATIKHGLDNVFKDDPNVFVAGDLLWYPVEGNNKLRTAPDALVALGRPKGYRGSYMQSREGGVAPQVVFEVLSPGNRYEEMVKKFKFYEHYGVQEYYIYDPDANHLTGYQRRGQELELIPEMDGWVSPRLNIRFELTPETLKLYGPDGRPFATYLELIATRDLLQQEKETAQQEKEAAQQKRESALLQVEQLKAQLRALGVEPQA